ncbi:hypothetical protein Tco_0317690 [Tanacetum coccineum]
MVLNRYPYCTGFGLKRQDDMVWRGGWLLEVDLISLKSLIFVFSAEEDRIICREFHNEASSGWRIDELLDLRFKVASDDLRDALSVIFGIIRTQASDEEIEGPMKDQPLSADASPTALSPGYIADSDPEEDKEDPEEDPADHPADG